MTPLFRKKTIMKANKAVRAAVPVSQASPGTPAIQVLVLRKSFGEKEAVAGIDLEIAAGWLAGLVGPNGAGKTASLSMSCRGRQLPIKLINIIDILTEVM